MFLLANAKIHCCPEFMLILVLPLVYANCLCRLWLMLTLIAVLTYANSNAYVNTYCSCFAYVSLPQVCRIQQVRFPLSSSPCRIHSTK